MSIINSKELRLRDTWSKVTVREGETISDDEERMKSHYPKSRYPGFVGVQKQDLKSFSGKFENRIVQSNTVFKAWNGS